MVAGISSEVNSGLLCYWHRGTHEYLREHVQEKPGEILDAGIAEKLKRCSIWVRDEER